MVLREIDLEVDLDWLLFARTALGMGLEKGWMEWHGWSG
jgi:hypothetical protein